MNGLNVSEATRILTLADRAAIASGAKPKNADLEPGVYLIDVTVNVKGTVKKGEDYTSEQPMALNPWALVGFLLSKVNRETAASVAATVIEAYESGALMGETFETHKKYAEDALASVAAATRVVKSGRTDCSVVLSRV